MKAGLLKTATKPKSAHADYETGRSGSQTKPGRDITDPGKISKAITIKNMAAKIKDFFSGRKTTEKHSKLSKTLASQNVLFRGASAKPTEKENPVKARDLASPNVLFKKRK